MDVHVVHPAQDWADEGTLSLPARVIQAIALADAPAWVGLLADGRVMLATPGVESATGRR